jgi:hypothetical protein
MSSRGLLVFRLIVFGFPFFFVSNTAFAHPPLISTSPDSLRTYICGREYSSLQGCFTHWCMSYDMANGTDRISKEDRAVLERLNIDYSPWSPCYVHSSKDGAGDVDAGGVAWWGWARGKLGTFSLDGFWVRDYRTDNGRDECGFNCTVYGFAGRMAENPDCYHVRQSWKTANHNDLPSSSKLQSDGWLDMAYCMRPMVAD